MTKTAAAKLTGTCEVVMRWAKDERDIEFCGTPATMRYPDASGGWMHLCDEHSIPHLNYATPVPHAR